jgi:hypothetical protein
MRCNPENPTEFYVGYARRLMVYQWNEFFSCYGYGAYTNIGDIAVDWKTGTIWVGTGEVNSSRSSYAESDFKIRR